MSWLLGFIVSIAMNENINVPIPLAVIIIPLIYVFLWGKYKWQCAIGIMWIIPIKIPLHKPKSIAKVGKDWV